MLALFTCWVLASTWIGVLVPVPRLYLFLGLVLGWTAATISGVTKCAWHSLTFRYVAWRTALALGTLWRWLTQGWPASLALLMEWVTSSAEGGKAIALAQAGQGLDPHKLFATPRGLEVAAAALSLASIYQMYQTRRRIIILDFKNHTGDGQLKDVIEGLPVRLLDELSTITGYYRMSDEAWPERKGGVIEAVIFVPEVAEALKGAITPESKVSLGPLTFPVGSIMAIFARIVQGPRVAGSVHKEGGKLLLVASLTGGGLRGNWRAEIGAWPESGPNADSLSELIEQLAYRIFADLGHVSSPRWRAARWHAEGLSAYRNARATGRYKKHRLLRAENSFIKALEEDNTFAQCHYNLGIVYRKLGRPESAESAFRKAITEAPNFSEAYYALGSIYADREVHEDAVWWCDQAIRLQPDDARAWNQKGLGDPALPRRRGGSPRGRSRARSQGG